MSFLKLGCGDDMGSPSERAKIEALLVDLVESEQRYEEHLQLIRAEIAELRQKLTALDPAHLPQQLELNLFPTSPSFNPSPSPVLHSSASYHLPPPPPLDTFSLRPPASIHGPRPPQIGGDLLSSSPARNAIGPRPPQIGGDLLSSSPARNAIAPRPPQIGGDLLSSSPARNAIGPRPPQIGGDLLSSSPARNAIEPRPPQIGGDNTLPLVVNPGANPIGPRPRPVAQIPQRIQWTEDREQQFSGAVATLGGINSATPSRLMTLMPGLTYNQLKHHLQTVRQKVEVQLPEDEQQ